MKRCVIICVLLLATFSVHAESRYGHEVVGFTHVAGKYQHDLSQDYLNEGAIEIRNLGARVIKVWLHWNALAFYNDDFNPAGEKWCGSGGDACLPHNQPYGDQLLWIAQHPHYQELFSRDFSTFVLEVLPGGWVEPGVQNTPGWWFDGMTDSEESVEQDATYRLSRYLMQTYPSNTFILQNHEGDHWLRAKKIGDSYVLSHSNPTTETLNGMIDWLKARQRGVEQARAELGRGLSGGTVLHAAEVNHISLSIDDPNQITMATHVLTSAWHQPCDLYSYSAYDANNLGWKIDRNLNYLADRAPDSPLYGDKNIYIGEYGAPENEVGGDAEQRRQVDEATRAFLGWGVQYAIYWQVYDNEGCGTCTSDSEFKGYWLRRRSGSYPSVYGYFQELMNFGIHHVGFVTSNGYYVSADNAGGGLLLADKSQFLEWEQFTILDRNGGDLWHDDPINILAKNGRLWMAYDGGGGALDASSNNNSTWERFTIKSVESGGQSNLLITDGATVALRTYDLTHYAVAEGGGGPGQIMKADRTAVGPWETFAIKYWQ